MEGTNDGKGLGKGLYGHAPHCLHNLGIDGLEKAWQRHEMCVHLQHELLRAKACRAGFVENCVIDMQALIMLMALCLWCNKFFLSLSTCFLCRTSSSIFSSVVAALSTISSFSHESRATCFSRVSSLCLATRFAFSSSWLRTCKKDG